MSKLIKDSQGWVEEPLENFFALKYKTKSHLFSQKSKYQQVDVVETTGHGKMLFNDGLAMISERDEFVYHEMLAHVPLFTHPNPQKVLIIGGGDGGTAREVLRHPNVEKCVMVEIDEVVVEACKEHFPQVASAMLEDGPRFELLIEDGVEFMKNSKEQFDVILIDSTDPIGPATPLFGLEFYQNVSKRLTDDGIVASQGESPFYFNEAQESLLNILGQLFPLRGLYNFSNLTYPGGLWSFTFGSKKYHPVKDFKSERVENLALDFDYYNEKIHLASFSLPNFMVKKFKGQITL